jgi:hypothetical protein
MSTDLTPRSNEERARESAEARAELLRLAEAQGVSPVTDFDELLGDPAPEDEGSDDVDEFLRWLREWRDTPSTRSIP